MCYDLRPPTQSLLHENLSVGRCFTGTRDRLISIRKLLVGHIMCEAVCIDTWKNLWGTHAKREGRMKTTWRRRMVYYVIFIPAQQVIDCTIIRLTSAISTSSAAAFVDFERSLRSKIARLQDKWNQDPLAPRAKQYANRSLSSLMLIMTTLLGWMPMGMLEPFALSRCTRSTWMTHFFL